MYKLKLQNMLPLHFMKGGDNMKTDEEIELEKEKEIDDQIKKELEVGEPEFKNIDEAVIFFKAEIETLKKTFKPSKKELKSKDDFKLYHEQTENRLNGLNEKLEKFESMINNGMDKLTHKGSSYTFNKVWDFLFKD